MAVEIEVTCDGGVSCRAVHGPSGAVLRTTPPVDNRGDGSTFSPTDLLATAFGACVLTIMAMAAEDRGIDLRGATARVEKHMTTDGPRRVARLELRIRIPVAPADEDRRAIERAGRGCPVCRSLGQQVETSIAVEWG